MEPFFPKHFLGGGWPNHLRCAEERFLKVSPSAVCPCTLWLGRRVEQGDWRRVLHGVCVSSLFLPFLVHRRT